MDFIEKMVKEDSIYKGKVIELSLQEVELHNGSRSYREIVKHPGGVAVLAYKDSETILLVEQFRKPFDKTLLELPAGKLDLNEEPEVCGRRELEEETGYKANKFTYLGKILSSPGFCNERIYLYKAEDLYKGTKGGDEDEFINVVEVKKETAIEMIKNGQIIDSKTICAFMY